MKCILCVLALWLSLHAFSLADEPSKKLPVPSAAAQAEATKSLKDLFKQDFAKRRPADMDSLAKKLLQTAADVKDDPVSLFVLLHEAQDLAERSGDVATAMKAIGQAGVSFDIDPLELKLKSLSALVKTATTAPDQHAIVEECLASAGAAIAADQYDTAGRLVLLARPISIKANDRSLAKIDALSKDIAAAKKGLLELDAALETLKTSNRDPRANLIVGKFKCFQKRDWESGLPMLRLGDDEALKAAATADLANPTNSTDQLKVADSWWDLAESQPESSKRPMRERASNWYELALSELSGFSRARAEKRIEQAPPRDTHFTATHPRIIDLLKLVDPEKDAVRAEWKLTDAGLVCGIDEYARLAFPYKPPAEYDFEIVFTRADGYDNVNQLCFAEGRPFAWDMGGWGGHAGFEMIDHKSMNENATKIALRLNNNQKYTSLLKVRRDGVQAYVDGKLVNELKTDYKNMELYVDWQLPASRYIGVGCWRAKCTFHSVKIIEITGHGEKLERQ